MRYCRFILPFLLLCLSAAAEDKPATGNAMDFLGMPRGTARSAMAGAGSASVSASAAFSAFDNPSILPFATGKVDASFSYGRWAPSTPGCLSDNLGVGIAFKPLRALALSVAVVNQAHPVLELPGYEPFRPLDGLASLGAGVSFGAHFSIGASFKYAYQRVLSDNVYWAFAFNAMAQYHGGHFDIAAGVVNVGGDVKSKDGSAYPLPSAARISGSYHGDIGKSRFEADLDADCYFSGKFGIAAGVQYTYNDLLFARAGYRYATAGAVLPSHLALGLGVQWKGFCLEASYITANDIIGNSFSLSIGYRY